MHRLLDLIERTTKVVVDLDTIVERAADLAANDPDAREQAESLVATASRVREHLIEGLDELKPRPVLH